MRYDHESMLPEMAFKPLGKRMTLEGGGGKGGKAPKAPDYTALANQQAQLQKDLLEQQTVANRINQFTPFGSLTYTRGGRNFDEAGYNRALQEYNRNAANFRTNVQPSNVYNPMPSSPHLLPLNADGTGYDLSGYTPFASSSGSSSGSMSGFSGSAPTREQFGFDPNQWNATTTLDPELQKILDNEFATKQQGYSELQNYLTNIQDPNRVNAAPIRAGQTAQQAIMNRLDPTFTTQEDQLRTRLMNQGVRAGSEAWDNEFRNFERSRNDAYSQAALQGIDLDFRARQQSLAEQGLPLNAIQSYLSGNQVQAPNFMPAGQAAASQAPDLLGAAQAQYGGALNAYNAQQAQQGNFMSGLFGLGGAALMGGYNPFGGGALGAALGGGAAGGTGINIAGFNPFSSFGF